MAPCILVVDDSSTIRKVVASILDKHGYEVALAIDGEDALEALKTGRVRADLVLLDFVMPRMNGYQFCRELRESPPIAMTPVILMSAKAERIRDQFVEQTGAVDAITKPFDAQALVVVIENAIRRVNQGRTSSTRLPSSPLDDLDDTGTPFESPHGQVSRTIATKLSHVVTRELARSPDATPGELASLVAERLQDGLVDDMVEAMRVLEVRPGRGPILRGDMALLPIGAIFQLLQAESLSGTLVCANGEAEVSVIFRHGLIDVVRSTGARHEFRLGRYFIEEGLVTSDEIDAILRGGTALGIELRKRLLGAKLQNAGKITETQLRAALTRQSSELLYEVLRWSKGSFEFRRELPTEHAFGSPNERLALPVTTVVMEGFRRADEWRMFESALGSFDAVLVRDDVVVESLDRETLESKERTVLDAVDGQRTVRAIVSASHLSSFDVCRVLAQFLEARVVRRRSAG